MVGYGTAGRGAGGHKPLAAFVKRQTGVDNPEWLTPTNANKVIEALKALKAMGERSVREEA